MTEARKRGLKTYKSVQDAKRALWRRLRTDSKFAEFLDEWLKQGKRIKGASKRATRALLDWAKWRRAHMDNHDIA